jgi:Heavy-metal resistance
MEPMMRRISLAVALLLVAGRTLAQPIPTGKWWRKPEIVEAINLSDEQQDRLETIFRASASDLIDLKAEIDKSDIALHGELDRPQLDRAALHRIAVRLMEARGRMFDRELMMLVEMRSVLTDPQWNRLRNTIDKLQQQRPVQRPMERPRP